MSKNIGNVEKGLIKKIGMAAYMGIFGAIMFLILSTINMLLYPGSFHVYYHVFPLDRYSFIYNNLSDMGMLYTFIGEPNFLSAALFTFTLTITGISFLIFNRYFPKVLETGKAYKLARIGSILGIISSVAFIGIGWTPWDVLLIPHMVLVFIGFLMSILFNIFFAIAIIRDKWYPNIYAFSFLLNTIVILAYILAVILGPSYVSLSGRVVESLGQKIVIYTQLIMQIVNSLGLLLVIRRKRELN